ncbi:hypothetical protein H0H81_008032 [Sphagnurus paluster]|uniref:DUF3533 domain-containing protein n=1 Tax=Sphagnurus paluster TaxID=117069 RepID=A0A9P7FWM6_9AGAR|nr:hypothetical protein H0H81_008032 [Sphagnurus paluster]
MSMHSTDVERTMSIRSTSPSSEKKPFSQNFFDQGNSEGRSIYLKTLCGGTFAIILVIFSIFPIYWGSLWKTPVRNIQGWVVDFDGGLVGQTVSQALTSQQVSQQGKVTWTAVSPSRFPNGVIDLSNDVVEQHVWTAIAIQAGSTERLQASYATPNASYDGTSAITVYGVEARNENAFRVLIKPSAQAALDSITQSFALQAASQLKSSSNLNALLTTSPQTVLTPISYTINNLRPFNIPVATAVTFVGLIYQLILSFFIVMIGMAAREQAGLNRNLTLRSLIVTRIVSSLVAYFFLALFYTLLSRAFQLDFKRGFGSGGFVIFWMLNWVGMLAVGLALESLITLLTARFIPFFMIIWIISMSLPPVPSTYYTNRPLTSVNVSVCIFPIEVMPVFYRYGYAMPFYNVSHAARAIVFDTKNTLGVNFGILIAWAVISCISLPLIQWYVRRKDVAAIQGAQQEKPKVMESQAAEEKENA